MAHPLCQYDVLNQGDRAHEPAETRRPPCRRPSTHVIREWAGEDELQDLYLCGSHTAAIVKRHPHDELEPERLSEEAA